MRLEGIHHITAITAEAQKNVDFYAGLLGLRLVKKTVNQDDPTVYHLFYADERGSPGSDITFFEYPTARRGRPGAGMVHRIVWRVASEEALGFWEDRLRADGVAVARRPGRLVFSDPEGLALELAVVEANDEPLVAVHPEIPAEVALQGFDGVRAFSLDPERSRGFLAETMGFRPDGASGYEARGEARGSFYAYDQARERGIGGAGTVHHVAWSSPMEEHEAWRRRVLEAGATPTPVIDRFYFRSIYFREPSGVLFEIATIGPGF
ncbi:MAG TPA: VOC family protein, partial [Gaiellaceae bacterium]|nr:VOC family protein [Gaiellaceae bacterium]